MQGTQSVVAVRGVTQRYSLSLEMRARWKKNDNGDRVLTLVCPGLDHP